MLLRSLRRARGWLLTTATASHVATAVAAGTITSSPLPIPWAASASASASSPLPDADAVLRTRVGRKAALEGLDFGPRMKRPERSTRVMAASIWCSSSRYAAPTSRKGTDIIRVTGGG